MSIFDKLFNKAANVAAGAVKTAVSNAASKKEEVTFAKLPESLEELQTLPEAKLDDPYKTAALTVVALCVYAADKNIGIEMLNFLKGPRPLTNHEISFIDDRLRDGKTYVPFSYFKGAKPENDYTPDIPYSITVESDPYSDANEGYKKLIIKSGGADTPREVQLRMKGDGQWLLWEQFLLPDIRAPKSADPWA